MISTEETTIPARESRLIGLISHLMVECRNDAIRDMVMDTLRDRFGIVALPSDVGAYDGKSGLARECR